MSRKSISFYNNGEQYYEFTNFYLAPINVSKIPPNLGLSSDLIRNQWKTSEHLFQAAKFTDLTIIKEIYEAKTPRKVYDLANGRNGKYKKQARSDWKNISLEVMLWVVKEKFTQNEGLKKLLLETGDAYLVEDSGKNDNFWGNGIKGNGIDYPLRESEGQNWLGKILMEIRNELKNKNSQNHDNQLRQARDKAVNEITNLLNQTPQITDNELNSSYQNWKETLKNTELNKIENFKNEVLTNIRTQRETKLAADKNNQLRQKYNEVITEITTILNQNPPFNDSELDYCQKWREELKKFTDLNKIEIFKKDVIAHIERKRKIKLESEEAKNDIKNAQDKSGEALRQDLKNLKKKESDKSHQQQQEEIEKLSKKSAQEDHESYRKMAVDLIKENFKENQIEESEIEKLPEIKDIWKKMKNGEIDQPEEIVNTEKQINKKVNEVGARKRIDKVVEIARQALKLGTKEELKKAIEEMIKFISSSNIYDQAIYSQQQKTINQLKSALENHSVDKSNSNLSPKSSLWKKVVPISLLVILGGGVMILIVKIINIKKKRQKKKI